MSSAAFELKDLILKAGAGAGKTTRLTKEFIGYAQEFHKNHKRYPNIVVTTFTRKATQELKERLLKEALDLNDEDLFQFVSSKAKVQISTIHGVLSLYLSRFGAAVGLTPDFKILSDAEIKKLSRKILKNHLFAKEEYLELLEDYDFATLEEMIQDYYLAGLFHSKLLPFSHTEMAELARQRLNTVLGPFLRVLTEIESQTSNDKWQAYAQHLRSLIDKIHQPNYTDEDWRQAVNLWTAIRKPVLGKTPVFDPGLHDEFEELNSSLKEYFKKDSYLPSFWEQHEKFSKLFQSLADRFSQDFLKMKLEMGLLAMGDLESLSYKLALDCPETATEFAQQWDYWMVDEYQDTSPIQVDLLKKLVGEKPVFIVGDPQQSIYLFRGARSEVFSEKVHEVHTQQGVVEESLVNYRSAPEVLEFFNSYFTKLSPDFSSMIPGRLETSLGKEEPVVHVIKTTQSEQDSEVSSEYLTVVARIQELLAQGVSPEQICVLGRTHKVLSQVSQLAQSYGVPIQLHSGASFYERREILDALSLLKFLVNPHDNENLVALLRSPWTCVADEVIISLSRDKVWSYWESCLEQLNSWPEEHPIRVLADYSKLTETLGYTWVFKQALVELGMIDFAAQIDSTGRREANLWKLVSILSAEEKRPGFNFLDFLTASMQELSAEDSSGDGDATPVIEPKRVNFMTVHASKGLQFEHVILPAMGQRPILSRAPHFMVHEKTGVWTIKLKDEESQSFSESLLATEILEELKKREAAEFNRVLYVALTRAKLGVTMIWNQDKVEKNSWAASFPLSLEEGLRREEKFSYLVRNENLQPQKGEHLILEQKDVPQKWTSAKDQTGIHYLSITEILEKSKNAQGAWLGLNTSQSVSQGLTRAQQGTDAHRLFEALKYSDLQTVLEISDDKMKAALSYIATTSEAPLNKIIELGSVEWGFALKYQSFIFQGQIDLWGLIGNDLWVVDYKTGSQKYSEMAFEQLKFYVWVLAKMGLVEEDVNIHLAVVYPVEAVIKTERNLNLKDIFPGIEKMIQNYFL